MPVRALQPVKKQEHLMMERVEDGDTIDGRALVGNKLGNDVREADV